MSYNIVSVILIDTSFKISYIIFRLTSQPEPHQYQALYNINGLSLGQTSFKIATEANIFKGVQYASETYPIQVDRKAECPYYLPDKMIYFYV